MPAFGRGRAIGVLLALSRDVRARVPFTAADREHEVVIGGSGLIGSRLVAMLAREGP